MKKGVFNIYLYERKICKYKNKSWVQGYDKKILKYSWLQNVCFDWRVDKGKMYKENIIF